MMYEVHTPGAWLVKGKEKKLKGEEFYEAKDINGWCSPSHRVLVKSRETGEAIMYFPGQAIKAQGEPQLTDSLSKKELKALMPDKIFPKKITRDELLEAYNAGD